MRPNADREQRHAIGPPGCPRTSPGAGVRDRPVPCVESRAGLAEVGARTSFCFQHCCGGRARLVVRQDAELGAVSEARLLLTCGLPGAGKTQLARQLAADRNAVRLTKDEWLGALDASPWDASTNRKVEQELWRLAQEILGRGVSVVLDFGLWARVERDAFRAAARELGVGSNSTTWTFPNTSCGGESKPATPSRPGTPHRSRGRTSTSGQRCLRLPTPTSSVPVSRKSPQLASWLRRCARHAAAHGELPRRRARLANGRSRSVRGSGRSTRHATSRCEPMQGP